MEKLSNWTKFLNEYGFKDKEEINTNPYKNDMSIKQIFKDNWDAFRKQSDVIKNGIRDCVIKEVNKMMGCKEFDNGFTLFECPECNKYTRVPFTCKSRFCNSCGIIYARERARKISSKTLDVPHRHVVFTIDDELRYYFKKDRKLLDCLFQAVQDTIFYALKKCGRKSENLTPGFIMVLHTFGRDLKWNPHIHVLLTEGGMTDQKHFKHVKYINFELLRKSFMKELFDHLAEHVDVFGGKNKFYTLKNKIYQNHKNGFYVYAPKQKAFSKNRNGTQQVITYILRYTGRPVMAQSRIEAYDKESQIIMYWYEPHEGGDIQHVTENVLVFIGKLIQHIMPEHFKSIRYAGIYAAKDHKYRDSKNKYKQKVNYQNKFLKFRESIIQDFKRDPLKCICGATMNFVDIFILENFVIERG